MTRLVIQSDVRDGVGTRELRNTDIWRGTVEFDAETGASQDLDDEVAEQFADRYDSIALESEADTDPEDAPPLDEFDAVLSGTVDEVGEVLAAGEHDDRLDELADRESSGKDRQGVHQAIEQRREARTEDADEDEDTE